VHGLTEILIVQVLFIRKNDYIEIFKLCNGIILLFYFTRARNEIRCYTIIEIFFGSKTNLNPQAVAQIVISLDARILIADSLCR
jgi:hypothetical protein